MDDDMMTTASNSPDDTTPSLSITTQPQFHTIGTNASAKTTNICTTIKARVLEEDDEKRAPVNILVALDVSGSMSNNNKLGLCKDTLKLLLHELGPRDQFGLVTFSNQACLEVPSKKMSHDNKTNAVQTINKLDARGGTNMSGAIGLAVQEMTSGSAATMNKKDDNVVNCIFLLTDGHATSGVLDPTQLTALTRGLLSDTNNISLYCFGYGEDHDGNLLAQMAQTTPSGTYYFIQQDSHVKTAFGDALGGILSVVAQNVSLTIRVDESARNMGVSIVKIHNDDAVQLDDNGSFRVPLGDVYAEETRDILTEIKLVQQLDLRQDITRFLRIDITKRNPERPHYHPTALNKLVQTPPHTVSISRLMHSPETSEENVHVAVQLLRVKATHAMKEANDMASNHHFAKANHTIESNMDDIVAKALALNVNFDRVESEFVSNLQDDLRHVKAGLESERTFHDYGSKRLNNVCLMNSRQRCAVSEELLEDSSSGGSPSNFMSARKESNVL
eukprot:CAMPEP_0118692340 /NCGR_PEP_ID=MMETSP0800-20121206/11220_1 /TAXON_ID=210618 ORGANISM="Striatella unipunctata, Strain CCMP2910" /NCGR_SAMPLE_ID=MMETSP0800 /ASSEMBLY_ACC=CAM_ASM_000638 /LENGTH=502 /DNA_ID=CAMNT_0006590297 /DNA_START=208 /DNA_END=1716 /DNA_ORIENTATION=-